MIHLTEYETRRNKILLAVIESFIQTALPVGSRTVSEISRLGLSTATIRNIMAKLEEEAYITHPHTSAGRIPTAKGYRFYVDHLIAAERLTEKEQHSIEEALQESAMIEKVMEKVARLLYEITDQVAVVLFPETESSLFKQIELIPVKECEILVVLVTSAGIIKNALVQVKGETSKEELLRISHFMNAELTNLTLANAYETLYHRLLDERSSFFYICKRAKEIMEESGLLGEEERLYLDGTHTILEKPEFQSVERIQSILSVLEEKKRLLEILRRDSASEGLHVYIGEEIGDDNIRGCSLVTSTYRVGKSQGTLGVMGPTRLNYGRVMSIVRHVASKVTEWAGAF